MLFDPKWEVEQRADPFSIDALIAWLEKQPADASYRYTDSDNCLLCQYFRSSGFDVISIANNEMRTAAGLIEFPVAFDWDVANSPGDYSTFGAALKRAHALRGSR